jgi:hypothetical protein
MLEQQLNPGAHAYGREAFTRVVQPVPTLVQDADGVYRLRANAPKYGELTRAGASREFTNIVLHSQNLAGPSWLGLVSAQPAAELLWSGPPFWTLSKTTSLGSEGLAQYLGQAEIGETHTLTLAVLAGSSSTFSYSIYNYSDGEGALESSTGEILEGPGQIQRTTLGSLFVVTGLSPVSPTLLRVTRTQVLAGPLYVYLYPGSHASGNLGDSVKVTRVQVVREEVGVAPGSSYTPAEIHEYAATIDQPGTLSRVDRVTNLLYPSSDFASWSNNPSGADPQGLPVTSNAMLAPDGTMTADVTSAGHTRYRGAQVSEGRVYTLSFYVHPADPGKEVWLYADGSPVAEGYNLAIFVPATLSLLPTSIGGVLAGKIEDAGEGWFRVQMTMRAAQSAIVNMHIFPTSDDVHGWWGAQIVEGWAAQDPIQTTTGPVSITRQLEGHQAGTLAVEGTATNLVRFSQNLDTSPWFSMPAVASGSFYKNVIPFWTLTKSVTDGSEARGQTLGPVQAGEFRTLTIALLAGTRDICNVGLYDNAIGWGSPATPGFFAEFEVLEGPGFARTTAWGNALPEVYNLSPTEPTLVRVTRNHPTAAPDSGVYIYPGTPYSNTIGDSILATRVDVRAGQEWDSYIPTTGSARTRPADQVFVRAAYPAGVDTASRRVNGFMWLVEAFFAQGVQRWTTWPLDVTWQGNDFKGLGALGSVSDVQEGESGDKGKVTLKLSPVAPGILPLAIGNVESYRGRPINIYVWPIDSNYRRVGQPILRHFGVMDQVAVKAEGDSGSVEMTCLSGGYNGARKSQGLRISHEQQVRLHPGDRGLEYALGLVNSPQLWLSKAFQEA